MLRLCIFFSATEIFFTSLKLHLSQRVLICNFRCYLFIGPLFILGLALPFLFPPPSAVSPANPTPRPTPTPPPRVPFFNLFAAMTPTPAFLNLAFALPPPPVAFRTSEFSLLLLSLLLFPPPPSPTSSLSPPSLPLSHAHDTGMKEGQSQKPIEIKDVSSPKPKPQTPNPKP